MSIIQSIASVHNSGDAASISMTSASVQYFACFRRPSNCATKLLGFDICALNGDPSGGPVLIAMSHISSTTGTGTGYGDFLWDESAEELYGTPSLYQPSFAPYTSFNFDYTIMEWLISPRGGSLHFDFPSGTEILLPTGTSIAIAFSAYCEGSSFDLSATFRTGR